MSRRGLVVFVLAIAVLVIAGVAFVYKMAEFAMTIANDDVEGFGAVGGRDLPDRHAADRLPDALGGADGPLPRHRASQVPDARARRRDRARESGAGRPTCLTPTAPIVAPPRATAPRARRSPGRPLDGRYHIYESNPVPWWMARPLARVLRLRRHLSDPEPARVTASASARVANRPLAVPGSSAQGCAHCDLPLGRRPLHAVVDGAERAFCCYGCVLAFQVTRARGETGAASAILVRLGLAVFFAMNVMMLSHADVRALRLRRRRRADGPLFLVLRVLAAVLAAPVLVLLGWPILVGALAGAPRRRRQRRRADHRSARSPPTCCRWANLVRGSPAVYFDTASDAARPGDGRPLARGPRARRGGRRHPADAEPRCRPTRCGRRRRREPRWRPPTSSPGTSSSSVRADAFPTDGIVVDGRGGVDESTLTGESVPVAKRPGASVAGGTMQRRRRASAFAPSAASTRARPRASRRCSRRPAASARPRSGSPTGSRAVLTPAVVVVAVVAGAVWTWRAGPEAGRACRARGARRRLSVRARHRDAGRALGRPRRGEPAWRRRPERAGARACGAAFGTSSSTRPGR